MCDECMKRCFEEFDTQTAQIQRSTNLKHKLHLSVLVSLSVSHRVMYGLALWTCETEQSKILW